MNKWIVVHFFNDNAIEAVPDTWLKQNICAWPIDKKNVKRCIETRLKPNKKEFMFFSARKLGNKVYGNDIYLSYLVYNCIIIYILDSLEEARKKLRTALYQSDLSSTEDENVIKYGKKKQKLNSNDFTNIKSSKNSDFPPRFNNHTTLFQGDILILKN